MFAPRDADARLAAGEDSTSGAATSGMPCFDSSGRVIGHIACADDKPMRDELPHHAILKIFSMRAAIELERSGAGARRRLPRCGIEGAAEIYFARRQVALRDYWSLALAIAQHRMLARSRAA